MKKIILIISAVIFVGLVAFWVMSPKQEATSQPSTATPNRSQAAVTAANNGTAYIYDVRTPEEYAVQHVDGAINFDVEKLKTGEMPDVPKDSQIYVYCRSGNRSAQATIILKDNGYANVTDLGGLDNLKNDGVL